MHLSKLEMHGFKSFARRTEMQFDKGITCVVGPNGSGKSNIADAVRWVLGEQSPRLLRGATMGDVIFGGTQKRRPLSFCEVTLTLDNSDGALPIDYAEVSVGRRVYRSGEGAYYINRNPCRLKDIVELFRDTGAGKEGYSIIGQGRIEEILSPKSDNRRVVFEEAAGILHYRMRREEAQRKLTSAAGNLQRVEDILGELENTLAPLELQSERARAYLVLAEEQKALELGLFAHQYKFNEAEGARLSEQEAACQRQLEQLQGDTAALRTALTSQREQLAGLDAAQQQRQLQQRELSRRLQEATAATQQAEQRLEYLRREAMRLEEALSAATKREGQLCGELEQSQQREQTAEQTRTQCAEQNQQAAAALEALQHRIREQERELAARLDRTRDTAQAGQRVQLEIAKLQAGREGLAASLTDLEQRLAEAKQREQQLRTQQEQTSQAFQTLVARREAAQATQTAALRQLAEAQAAQKCALASAEKARKDLQYADARRRTLADMLRSREGFAYSVRKALEYAKQQGMDQNVYGVVAELIAVPDGMETALEVALGQALQNIVTATAKDAQQLIEHLRTSRQGRATFCPLDSMQPRSFRPDELALMRAPGCLGAADALLTYDARYAPVVSSLLGRTAVAEHLDAAMALAKRGRQSFRIVTLAGDLLSPGGAMTGGSRKESQSGLLQRKREIQQLTRATREAAQRVQAAEQTAQAGATALQQTEAQHAAARQALQSLDIDIAAARQKLSDSENNLRQAVQALSEAGSAQKQAQAQAQELEQKLDAATASLGELDAGQRDEQSDAKQLQAQVEALEQKLESARQLHTQAQIRHSEAKQRCEMCTQERERIARELTHCRALLTADGQKRAGNAQQIADTQAQRDQAQQQLDTLIARQNQQDAQDEGQSARRAALAEQVQQQEEELDRLRNETLACESKHGKLQVKQSKLQVDGQALVQHIWDTYGVSYAQAANLPLTLEASAAKRQVAELKNRIRGMGNINVAAVEEYASARTRYDDLTAQRADLLAAQQDLQELVDSLQARMRKEFSAQFAVIDANFSRIFEELFEGGVAHLRLEDEADVLNCNIEIVAQPPGKKLQSIQLLSGGEKALTAIALLFAMLSLKPTPFCILDEIEAALDDANALRFSSYLKRYSQDVQFIVITHRKDSMQAGDALYGVTMEEKGVSKLISVRLEDAAV